MAFCSLFVFCCSFCKVSAVLFGYVLESGSLGLAVASNFPYDSTGLVLLNSLKMLLILQNVTFGAANTYVNTIAFIVLK